MPRTWVSTVRSDSTSRSELYAVTEVHDVNLAGEARG